MTSDDRSDPEPDPQGAMALTLVRLANGLGLRGLAQVAHGTERLLRKRVQALADNEEERDALRAEVEMWPQRILDLIAAKSDRGALPNAIAAFKNIAAAEDISRPET